VAVARRRRATLVEKKNARHFAQGGGAKLATVYQQD
jgi:hypothetical protein